MPNRLSRSRFLGSIAATAAAPALLGAAPLHPVAVRGLETLLAGNARFVADKATCPPLTARRLELAEGQSPFVAIVSCSDSRVPVETVFDQTPGAIFGVRVAGNFVDEHGLGSLEYAVAALGSSLILVLGHSACGAVKAAVQYAKDGTAQPSHIQSLVTELLPAAKATKDQGGDWVHHATVKNVNMMVAALPSRSPILAKAVHAQNLSIAGAIYDLHTGKVSLV